MVHGRVMASVDAVSDPREEACGKSNQGSLYSVSVDHVDPEIPEGPSSVQNCSEKISA